MEHSARSWGRWIQARMTIVRLSDDSLFLISPVRLTKQLQGRLEVLGPVRHISVPNKFHPHTHQGVGVNPFPWEDYVRAYPEAKRYAPPGLDKKRKDLHVDRILQDSPEPPWKEDLDQTIFQGAPVLEEVAFFHRVSQTLILGDLGRVRTASFLRWGLLNHRAARRSLEKILDWDFGRIIAYDRIWEQNGKDALRKAYAWLL